MKNYLLAVMATLLIGSSLVLANSDGVSTVDNKVTFSGKEMGYSSIESIPSREFRTRDRNSGNELENAIFSNSRITSNTGANGTTTINNLDTVVIDLSQTILFGNHIQFPVSILTNDTIFSLDFSFKLDPSVIAFDSIINLANYLQVFSYYNSSDSTLRFTSNSLQNYGSDTPLVLLDLSILSTQITSTDFISPHAYLNGSACTFKIISALITDIPLTTTNNSTLSVFPNPSSGESTISFKNSANTKVTLSLNDMLGNRIRDLYTGYASQGEFIFKLETADLNAGVYFLNLQTDRNQQNIKIVVAN